MPGVHLLDADHRERVIAVLSEDLAARPEVSFAYVFGSFLQAGGFRDVDVAVWATASEPGFVDVQLAADLSRRLGLPVDVRRLNDAPVPFLFKVLRGRRLCARDELLLANLLERTARQYHDIAPILRRATREAFAA